MAKILPTFSPFSCDDSTPGNLEKWASKKLCHMQSCHRTAMIYSPCCCTAAGSATVEKGKNMPEYPRFDLGLRGAAPKMLGFEGFLLLSGTTSSSINPQLCNQLRASWLCEDQDSSSLPPKLLEVVAASVICHLSPFLLSPHFFNEEIFPMKPEAINQIICYHPIPTRWLKLIHYNRWIN